MIIERAYRIRNSVMVDGKLVTPTTTAVTVLFRDSRGIVLAYGATVPTDAEAGYANGCLFVDTNGGIGATVYVNEGSATSCDFNLAGLASGDITGVTAGAGLIGGGVSGPVTIDVVADEASIEVTADEIHVKALGILAAHLGADSVTPVKSNNAEAVTATTDGLTTGLVSITARHVTVTSDDANKIVTLPAAVAGKVIMLYVGATGCEIRTPAASNVKINNVDSDGTNELAIPATSLVRFVCVGASDWIATAVDELGAAIAALVPDVA